MLEQRLLPFHGDLMVVLSNFLLHAVNIQRANMGLFLSAVTLMVCRIGNLGQEALLNYKHPTYIQDK